MRASTQPGIEDLYREHALGLVRFALLLTGDRATAEDVVQDAFLGLTRARQAGTTITDPKAYLTTVVSRLGINYLSSARVRRETYVGDWLPEPVVVPAGGAPKIPPAWHLRVTPARGAGS